MTLRSPVKRQLITATLLTIAAAGVGACSPPTNSYAGTVTWGAPLAHDAGQYPQIVVEDDTTRSWPIQQAIAGWGVPVSFGRCQPSVTCVKITEVSSLGSNRVGLTSRPVATGPETITIQLADNPKMNAAEAWQDITHEFGHALGLGHDDIGVMNATITGAYRTPNAAELARVRSIYLG
jgi:hypothetical protein